MSSCRASFDPLSDGHVSRDSNTTCFASHRAGRGWAGMSVFVVASLSLRYGESKGKKKMQKQEWAFSIPRAGILGHFIKMSGI